MTRLHVIIKHKMKNMEECATKTEAAESKLKNKLSVAVSFALISSGAAFAAPPVAYDGWTVTGGVIDTAISCASANTSCRELAPAEGGFKYEEVTSDGSSFFRLILTEKDATGDPLITSGVGALSFTNESFTPFAVINAGIAQGVATKQVVRDSAANFEITAEIQKGNMRGLYATTAEDMYSTKIAQAIGSASGEFESAFNFTNYTEFSTNPASNDPDTNTEIGRKLDMSQNVLVGEAGDTTKKQAFTKRQASGVAGNTTSSFVWSGSPPGLQSKFMVDDGSGPKYFIKSDLTTAGSMTLPATSNGKLDSPAASNTVSWVANEDISTTWIAQSSNSPFNAGGVDVNYQSVANNTAGTEASSLLIELPSPTVNPFDWDTNFGAEPSL